MPYSVNHATRIVTVPRDAMPLTQSSPEVRGLDLADFHANIRLLEDSEEGIVFQTESRFTGNSGIVARTPGRTFGGVPLPQIVELINSYFVVFEDGPYAVTVSGGNSNLFTRTIKNQVSVAVANSAGLVNGDITEQIVEGDETVRDTLRLIRAALVGKASGAATNEMRFRDKADTKDRIVAAVDEFGNRSGIQTDADD